jgi:chemotaxis methyl-accepting protein methylase
MYKIKDTIKADIKDIMECDYTKMDKQFISKYNSDIVFCNNSLLYHSPEVQEKVLEKLCLQAKKILIISGAGHKPLELILRKNGFRPYKENWKEIYEGWKLRRCKYDKVYPTPTTPYLSDRDRDIEQFFRYSIFIKD